MVASYVPTEDELYLFALLTDPSGIDFAEFSLRDDTPGNPTDNCFRAWDFQWPWWRDRAMYQADQASRTLGKSQGIAMRAAVHPFCFPGQERLITAPELNHLRPVVDAIEKVIRSVWFLREMCPRDRHMGISRQPHWQIRFLNGAEIRSRLPQRDGKGVKGCLAPGTLVLTRRGQVPVEDVVKGDEVLTHRGRWRKVLGTPRHRNPDAIEVAGGGHRGLVMSDNHRMYGRRNRNPQRSRNLDPATWCIPGEDVEIPQRWYFGSPTVFPEADSPVTANTAWVAGRYVADGYLNFQRVTRTSARLHVIVRFEKCDDVVQAMKRAGLRPTARLRGNGTYNVEASDTHLCRWLDAEFGQHAESKRLPVWLLGAPHDVRRAFLDGYLAGDGHWDARKRRWVASTASKPLAVSLRLLAQSLGYTCGLSWVDPKVTEVCGRALVASPRRSWRVTMCESSRNAVVEDGIAWQKVRKVTPIGELPMVHELVVDEDCSYIADGLISHNNHPVIIELDEAQDYPDPGYTEIIECLKEVPGAQWRLHGVPKGLRDRFWKFTTGNDPALPFKVHRKMAMERPTWNDLERRRKIALYDGSRLNPDYRRNLYGEHGDATSPLFVLAHLMACVDRDENSEYNTEIYAPVVIMDEELEELRDHPKDTTAIETLLEQRVPGIHRVGYSAYFGGGDVGVTNHPSEFLIFGQVEKKDKLRLLLRLHLERVSVDEQKAALLWLRSHYLNKLRFGIDRAGVGYGLWQPLSDSKIEDGLIRPHQGTKDPWFFGFDFGEKIVSALNPDKGEDIDEQMEQRFTIDYLSEELRHAVDAKRIELPLDNDLLNQFQGQTTAPLKGGDVDPNRPKKRYSTGTFHALDGAKYMIGGRVLWPLHKQILQAKEAPRRPVYAVFPGARV